MVRSNLSVRKPSAASSLHESDSYVLNVESSSAPRNGSVTPLD